MSSADHQRSTITIVYASRASGPMDAVALTDLLHASRARNESAQVTGMLLYAYESFVQQIEGEATAVDAIFASITRDPRHTDLRLLSRRPISQRRYSEWAMGAEHPFAEASHGALISYTPVRPFPRVDGMLIRNREVAENLLMLVASRQRRAVLR